MSASSVPSTPALPIRVAAGTTAADALREAGVDLNGPDGAVVVRDPEVGMADTAIPSAVLERSDEHGADPAGLQVRHHRELVDGAAVAAPVLTAVRTRGPEAGQALVDVSQEVGLGHFSIGDDIDAQFALPLNDVIYRNL